jgi:hypothetical protein
MLLEIHDVDQLLITMTTNRSISPSREAQQTLQTDDIVQVVSKNSLYFGQTGVVIGFLDVSLVGNHFI